MLLDGEPTVSCDISHAHHCFLPRILSDRIAYLHKKYGPSARVANYEAERLQLIEFLSEGDYYAKWCVDQDDVAERGKKKQLLNVMLNMPNTKCQSIGLYQQMRRTFPLTFRTVEEIKCADHRNISKPTQHYTAKAISKGLLELQATGVLAIPDVDAIICQQRHKESVCQVLGCRVYEVSGGVRCKVGGIRYSPIPETKNQTPALGSAEAKLTGLSKPGTCGPSGGILQSQVERNGINGQAVFFFRELTKCESDGRHILRPYRPLTEHEQDLLRRKGLKDDPLVIEALNIFEGSIVA